MEKNCILDTNRTHQVEEGKEEVEENVVNLEENLEENLEKVKEKEQDNKIKYKKLKYHYILLWTF